MPTNEILDAIVIGAGPGGLTGAIYLARFRRQFIVLDAGQSRAGWIPRTHNYPGFPGGIAGSELLARLRRQARSFGATISKGSVDSLTVTLDGFDIRAGRRRFKARTVLLATGVIDTQPKLRGLDEAIARHLVRTCPICDGYEVRGKAIGVIGASAHGAREALFLRTYSDDVTLIHVGEAATLPDSERRALAAAGLTAIETPIEAVSVQDNQIAALSADGARVGLFDTLYLALGSTSRNLLARLAGAELDDQGRLKVSEHQHTSVDGLYAAGDLVRGLNQIIVAEAEAAIAATDIHNRLRAAGI